MRKLIFLIFILAFFTGSAAFAQNAEPEAVCGNREDICAALDRFTAQGVPSFRLVIPRPLGLELTDDDSLFAWMAFRGVEKCRLRYIDADPMTFLIGDIQKYTVPFRAVSDENELLDAVDDMSRDRTESFVLVLETDFFNALQADVNRRGMLYYCSALENCELAVDPALHTWNVSGAAYSDRPKLPCHTEEDVITAVRGMGASGTTDFELVVAADLYQSLRADEFTRLSQLTAEAGMSGGSLRYTDGEGMGVLIYQDSVIRSDVKKLTTPFEAAEWVEECAGRGEKEIPLFCTPELYRQLLEGENRSRNGEQMILTEDVVYNAGIHDYSWSRTPASGLICLHVKEILAGTVLLRAARSGDLSALSDRERQALEMAGAIAGEYAGLGSPLETAAAIHDRICAMTVYGADDATEEDDCAIGVLLNGKANCDGYADAFFLIGSLAGLEVRYQYGDSCAEPENGKDGMHIWNLLKIDGTWRTVDVTWDDQQGGIRRTWFNLGEDRARRCYIWNRETALPLLSRTALSERPAAEYLIGGAGVTAEEALRDVAGKGLDEFEWVWADGEPDTHEAAKELIAGRAGGSYTWSWDDRMLALHVSGYR